MREPTTRSPLSQKRVLLGVSGGIAAYKGVEILRGLQALGAEVRVVMTASARRFVQPLTFEALSHHRVYSALFPEEGDPDVIHVTLGKWPDLLLVAPITANLIAKMANGLADDLLSCILLACRAPVMVAPAMESHMYLHPAVQRNLERLRAVGCRVVDPEEGELASGEQGIGRLADPCRIVEAVVAELACTDAFVGRRIVVTAGRTEEDIDAVRFITNRSTGKMGYALARQAALRGAEVTLISGPSQLSTPPGVHKVPVRTVEEMRNATTEAFERADALIMTAAVLDFRPKHVSPSKIKKSAEGLRLDLDSTEDFLVELGAEKGKRVVVGFAMETENGLQNAQAKLEAKHLDLIVLNDLTVEGAGFGVDTNVVTLIDRTRPPEALPLMQKVDVADRILDRIGERWGQAAVVERGGTTRAGRA